ncbi:hypothetical protein [Bosea sp. (in: a-proteobacteria)]|uniref:hypothetical protein n=1 Tax=Bosea sp. (in: a-proteobacteria) TaxID=1871050 RepID=UPI002735A98C|nr:hypothetical protein [Bosea sp. (in: a-proteobacteria)]MDP3257243.1 hypothetical protein [Bosea sp. (in: a-proteobacteria)]
MPFASRRSTVALFGAALLATSALPGQAQPKPPENWPAIKCERYTKAYGDALSKLGRKGLGQEFLDSHEAFLASGCSIKGEVCPRSAEELNLANIMVVMGMNQGMASTFMPFACPKR